MNWLSALAFSAILVMVGCGKAPSAPTTKGSYSFTDKLLTLSLPNQGGQPATITLRGIILTPDGRLDERVKLELMGGFDRKGKRVTVENSAAIKTIDFSEKNKDRLNMIPQNNFISIGCEKNPKDFSSITDDKKPITQSEQNLVGVGIITADTVLICGPLAKTTLGWKILANTLLLSDVIVSDEEMTKKISLVTRNLILNGENKITSTGRFKGFWA